MALSNFLQHVSTSTTEPSEWNPQTVSLGAVRNKLEKKLAKSKDRL